MPFLQRNMVGNPLKKVPDPDPFVPAQINELTGLCVRAHGIWTRVNF